MLAEPVDQTLNVIAIEQKAAGESVEHGASADQISKVSQLLREEFALDLPESYAEILQLRNGIDYNGTVFYSANHSPENPSASGFWQGLVPANAAWRDEDGNKALLILGDNSMDFFAFNPATKRFGRHDRVTGELIEQFSNAKEMVQSAIESAR